MNFKVHKYYFFLMNKISIHGLKSILEFSSSLFLTCHFGISSYLILKNLNPIFINLQTSR